MFDANGLPQQHEVQHGAILLAVDHNKLVLASKFLVHIPAHQIVHLGTDDGPDFVADAAVGGQEQQGTALPPVQSLAVFRNIPNNGLRESQSHLDRDRTCVLWACGAKEETEEARHAMRWLFPIMAGLSSRLFGAQQVILTYGPATPQGALHDGSSKAVYHVRSPPSLSQLSLSPILQAREAMSGYYMNAGFHPCRIIGDYAQGINEPSHLGFFRSLDKDGASSE